MKLFLTSSASTVISDIVSKLGFDQNGKKLVFIKTAAEDERDVNPEWLEEDRKALKKVGFEVTDYTLSGKNTKQLQADLSSFDVIFVSGGNTFYLLQESQKSKFIPVIHKLVEQGKVYIGSSAGSVIAGFDISPALNLDDKAKAPDLQGTEGYKLVDFVCLPHWGSDYFRNLYLNHRFDHVYGMDYKLIFLTDNQYIEVKEDWYRIIDIAY
jgi:dipeptidase E